MARSMPPIPDPEIWHEFNQTTRQNTFSDFITTTLHSFADLSDPFGDDVLQAQSNATELLTNASIANLDDQPSHTSVLHASGIDDAEKVSQVNTLKSEHAATPNDVSVNRLFSLPGDDSSQFLGLIDNVTDCRNQPAENLEASFVDDALLTSFATMSDEDFALLTGSVPDDAGMFAMSSLAPSCVVRDQSAALYGGPPMSSHRSFPAADDDPAALPGIPVGPLNVQVPGKNAFTTDLAPSRGPVHEASFQVVRHNSGASTTAIAHPRAGPTAYECATRYRAIAPAAPVHVQPRAIEDVVKMASRPPGPSTLVHRASRRAAAGAAFVSPLTRSRRPAVRDFYLQLDYTRRYSHAFDKHGGGWSKKVPADDRPLPSSTPTQPEPQGIPLLPEWEHRTCRILGCNYTAKNSTANVYNHMRVGHFVYPGDKCYACQGCGLRFADPRDVLRRRHQYECSQIGGEPLPVQCMREQWERAENAELLKPEFRAGLLPAPHDLPVTLPRVRSTSNE